MSKIENIKAKVDQAEDFARKIWLAGLGAYGKGFDQAQSQYEKLDAEAKKLFDELVAKGEKLETEAKEKFSTEKNSVTEKVDARLQELREKLGLGEEKEDKVAELSAKIDELTTAVAKLAK